MTKKLMGALVFSLTLAACAGTMHVASVSEAFKKYEQRDYEATLRLVELMIAVLRLATLQHRGCALQCSC